MKTVVYLTDEEAQTLKTVLARLDHRTDLDDLNDELINSILANADTGTHQLHLESRSITKILLDLRQNNAAESQLEALLRRKQKEVLA